MRIQNLTPRDFSDLIGCSLQTVYREIRRGNLHAFRVGRSLRIPVAELERYIQPEEVARV